MKFHYIITLVVVNASIVLMPYQGFSDDSAESILKKVEKKYDTIKDITLTFDQHVQYGVTKAEQSFSGKLIMKKGNKYRIELEDQAIITDGKVVWSYTKNNNQVIINTYKEDPRSFSPDKVLVNVPHRFSVTLLSKEEIQGEQISILKLIPNDAKSNVQWMKVWVGEEWTMKKIQMFDMSDNLMTYTVNTMKINTGVNDSEFKFAIPAGVEVIDLR